MPDQTPFDATPFDQASLAETSQLPQQPQPEPRPAQQPPEPLPVQQPSQQQPQPTQHQPTQQPTQQQPAQQPQQSVSNPYQRQSQPHPQPHHPQQHPQQPQPHHPQQAVFSQHRPGPEPVQAQVTAPFGQTAPPPPPSHEHPALPHQKRPDKKPASRRALFLGPLFGVLVGAALTFALLFFATDGFHFTDGEKQRIVTIEEGSSGITITPLAEDASLAEVVAAKALPSIVNIDVYTATHGSYDDYGDSSSGDSLEEYGLGSGIILSADGYILTNYHVVESGDEFLVNLDQDRQLKGSLVGSDPSSDLAVLKVDATGLIPIETADSSEVRVGEWVMALGSPFGLEKSVSTGIVSALFRSTTMESASGASIYTNMIQTDAAINPGNSGGALVNAEGHLIGVNTLISSSTNSSAGVGFAIPSNYALNIAEQIMSGKEVEHAFLGVTLNTVDSSNADQYDATVDAGAHIEEVVRDSPADKAGLVPGDIIISVDETPVSTAAEVVIEVRGRYVGDVVTIEFMRGSERMSADVKLGADVDFRD
ncbi:MAG: trypsin-like peptidase domain-containing protein [Coriobacteriales bacterium]|jgi:putative serine protease PepD|nr:trypsin-like peptidase domain-containing protein [Coriobacteriales bacterium]